MPPLPRSADFAIRSSIRVLGALLMLALAYGFAEAAMALFEAEEIRYGSRWCGSRKGWWLCELGNVIASFVPPSMRGIVEGASGLLAAAFFMCLAWLLVKPVLQRARKTSGP